MILFILLGILCCIGSYMALSVGSTVGYIICLIFSFISFSIGHIREMNLYDRIKHIDNLLSSAEIIAKENNKNEEL